MGGFEAIAYVYGGEFFGRGDSNPTRPMWVSEGKHCIAADCSFFLPDIVEKLGAPISAGAPTALQSEFL